jgi:hypothetical protein
LALKLGKQILIIRFTVPNHRLDQAAQLAGFQPQAFGFMGTVAHILAGA